MEDDRTPLAFAPTDPASGVSTPRTPTVGAGYVCPDRRTKFAGDSDSDLLGYMALRREDSANAQEAGIEFCLRHGEWLHQRVRGLAIISALGGKETGVVDDVVQETLFKAFLKASSYEPQRSSCENVQASVRGWLVGIAKHVVLDVFSGAKAEAETSQMMGDWNAAESEVSDTTSGKNSPKLVLVQEAMSQLTERERTILFTSTMYEKPGEEHQRLPNEVMAQLAQLLQTTPTNIRAIRMRAKTKILTYVEAKLSGQR